MEKVPYLLIFLAALFIYVPRLFVAREQARMPEGYDNANPREQQARLGAVGRRANAAHQNSIEAFPLFAAAILACRVAKVDLLATVVLGAIFVVARAIYIWCYVTDEPSMRSAVWGIGLLANCALFLYPIFRGG
jgi:uncharacterized MAPEG superfamily protein